MNRPAVSLSVTNLRLTTSEQFSLEIDSLQVNQGEFVAIVGANGSGKTTLVESILGLRETSSGDISMLGHDYRTYLNREVKLRNLGVQLQNVSYPDNYKVREIVELHRVAYGHRNEGIYSMLDIDDLANARYVKLSRGQKQRVDLYIAFAHEPDLVILDEPSTGLDQVYKKAFYEILERHCEFFGRTSIVVTHTGAELSRCSKVVWLHEGAVHSLLEVPREAARGVIEEKLHVIYSGESAPVVEGLNSLRDVKFVACESSTSILAFGPDLADAERLAGQIPEVHAATRNKTEGTEFLRFVADSSFAYAT